MKIKLDSIEALAKAHGAMGTHFKKAADHHGELAKAHGEHAAFLKGKHDAMADDDMHKAAFGKMSEHQDCMAKLHKAYSEHLGKMADEHSDETEKAAATGDVSKATGEVKPGDVVDIGSFVNKSAIEVMADLSKTADFKTLIGEYVMNAVKESLGKVVPPLATKAVGKVDPNTLTPVARPGEKLPEGLDPLEKSEMPSALAHWTV